MYIYICTCVYVGEWLDMEGDPSTIFVLYIYIVVMKGMFRCEKYGFGSNMMRWLKSCLWQVLNGVDMH